ncbi:MAG: hypothetical protein N4A45_07365 [Flavobacteriales bacterium]|jgi:N-acetylglucosamine kinase-like BadF-type ATPase|nr:hypothetical protein [Flavobacteriales bacterium]
MMSRKILIADIGSTKGHWRSISEESIDFFTEGFNPNYHTQDQILPILDQVKNELEIDTLQAIYFYGSGINDQTKEIMITSLKKTFGHTDILVENDLIAAAYALYPSNKNGWIGILGTGMNLRYYSNHSFKGKEYSLGYILGDEGSGAFIGKQLINDFVYENMPQENIDFLSHELSLNRAIILKKVYQEKNPQIFLASFCEILKKLPNQDYTNRLLHTCFTTFVKLHILPNIKENEEVRIMGSVAFHFQNELKNVAQKYDLKINKIIKSPMDGLAAYHDKKEH